MSRKGISGNIKFCFSNGKTKFYNFKSINELSEITFKARKAPSFMAGI